MKPLNSEFQGNDYYYNNTEKICAILEDMEVSDGLTVLTGAVTHIVGSIVECSYGKDLDEAGMLMDIMSSSVLETLSENGFKAKVKN